MHLKIEITKVDIGTSYESIKSLLTKPEQIELNKDKLKSFELIIENFKEENYNELSFSILWRYLVYFKKLKCEKTINLPSILSKKFNNRRFLQGLTNNQNNFNLTGDETPINYESFRPLRPKKGEDNNTQIDAIVSSQLNKILSVEKRFHGEMRIHILEMINNTFDHSNRENDAGSVLVKEGDFVSFCIIDMGQGIKKSFLSNAKLSEDFKKIHDNYAILKATELNVSCNPVDKRHPEYSTNNGGIGLYFLKKFIQMHSDSIMVIASNKGYVSFDNHGRIKNKNFISTAWPGTIVYFRTRLRDTLSMKYHEEVQKSVDSYDIDNSIINIV